jgi:hypothetical protein
MLFNEVVKEMPLEECRVLEIGHGIGSLSTIVAEALPVHQVLGIDVNFSRFQWSVRLGYEYLQEVAMAAPLAFILKDASTLDSLRGVHVLFAFDVGMSPNVLRMLARLQKHSGTVRFTFTFFDEAEMHSFGFENFELRGSIKISMLGGKGSFTGYLYKFVNPVGASSAVEHGVGADLDADLEEAFGVSHSKMAARMQKQINECAAAEDRARSSRHHGVSKKRSPVADSVQQQESKRRPSPPKRALLGSLF